MTNSADISRTPPRRPTGVGLGYFDGLHRGHMELVRSLVHRCAERGLLPAILTFDRHPSSVPATARASDPPAGALMTLEEKRSLLLDAGVEEIVVQTFDEAFASMTAERFLEEVLYERLDARLVVVGHDYRFGRGRTGDVALLRNWGQRRSIEVLVTEPVTMGGTLVKSTAIRNLVSSGRTLEAASLLGRCYSLSGTVERGRGLGRRLGFPTANFHAPKDKVLPDLGIYRTRARVGDRTYEAVTNIGLRPTVEADATDLLVETCLFGADLDLYGRTLEVMFLERLREERRYDDLESLTAQVRLDIEQAMAMHRADETGWTIARIEGVPVDILRTNRFRTALCTVVAKVPLRRETAARNSLLTRILSSGCARLPERTEVAEELDSLYGAEIHATVEREGDLQTLSFTADALARWTDGTSPFEATCSLLFEMLLTPAFDGDGEFPADVVEEERQNLLSEIASRVNDRTRYVIDRCTGLFCGDSPHGLDEDGDEESARAVTRRDLADAYGSCFRDGILQVHLAGDVDDRSVEEVLAAIRRLVGRFPGAGSAKARPGTAPAPLAPPSAVAPIPTPREFTDRRNVEQARVCIAYSGGPSYYSMDSVVMTVLNSLLGGDAHSLLFERVREEQGLAYSVFSAPLRYLSGILLCAGVPVDRTEEAVRAMRLQVEAIAADDFPDRFFDSSIRMTESAIRSRGDDLGALAAIDLAGISVGRRLRREESLLLVRSVTRRRVVEMARRLKESVLFVQLPEGGAR